LHLVPSGILQPHTRCYLGNGVVVDPAALLQEIDFLTQQGVRVQGRLFISHRAHVVMPYHKLLDQTRESADSQRKIGTTGRGIGPAYVDKAHRMGIRLVDLLHEATLREKILYNLEEKNAILHSLYGKTALDAEAILQEYRALDARLDPFITEVSRDLNQALEAGKRILCEGAQGTLLDLDFGTYPYVTSSSPVSGGACIGLGLGPTKINHVLGVIKAYTTRVGMGPFPTEIGAAEDIDLRGLGAEFGATTGRPRRCGWFDAVVANYAVQVNGIAAWAVTKLDVLDTLEELKICVAYRFRGKEYKHFPAEIHVLEQCEPVYESLPGWQEPSTSARDFRKLPPRAQAYLKKIETVTHTPLAMISVGPERDQTILC